MDERDATKLAEITKNQKDKGKKKIPGDFMHSCLVARANWPSRGIATRCIAGLGDIRSESVCKHRDCGGLSVRREAFACGGKLWQGEDTKQGGTDYSESLGALCDMLGYSTSVIAFLSFVPFLEVELFLLGIA